MYMGLFIQEGDLRRLIPPGERVASWVGIPNSNDQKETSRLREQWERQSVWWTGRGRNLMSSDDSGSDLSG